jgi:hypothetical protein
MSRSPYISFQPMRVLIDGHDSEGYLVLADDQLAAVIVRLDGEAHDATARGLWHLEAGFGKCAAPPYGAPLWATPEEAGLWVEEKLGRRSGRPGNPASAHEASGV